MNHRLIRLRIPIPAVVLAVLLAYPLSYAPIVKKSGDAELSRILASLDCRVSFRIYPFIDGEDLPVYRPVDWLIDHTPLRTPLFLWADVWGVRRDMEAAAWSREKAP